MASERLVCALSILAQGIESSASGQTDRQPSVQLQPLLDRAEWRGLREGLEVICLDSEEWCASDEGRLAFAAVAARLRRRFADDVEAALDRREFERASRLTEDCVNVANAAVPGGLDLDCRALLTDVERSLMNAALARAEAMLGDALPRRIEAWIRVAMRERGVSLHALDAALESHGGYQTWLRIGPALRVPTPAERAALESVLGPLPPTLAAELDGGSRAVFTPWAAIRQARAELAAARASLGRLDDGPERRLGRARVEALARRVDATAHAVRAERRTTLMRDASHRLGSAAIVAAEIELDQASGPPPNPYANNGALVLSPRAGLAEGAAGHVLVATSAELEHCSVVVESPVGASETVALVPLSTRPSQLNVASGTWHAAGEGLHRASLRCDGTDTAADEARAGVDQTVAPRYPQWDQAHEALYGAWIQRLFDVPEGTSWSSLHEVTGDAGRNFLWNHLGAGEDALPSAGGLELRPDCADLALVLRAYFAWKLSLPFGHLRCGLTFRGVSLCEGQEPSGRPRGFVTMPSDADPGRFGRYLHIASVDVGTSLLREDHWADLAMLYPVALTVEALRPGTVYVDPHGHSLVVVRWESESDGARRLLAVNAQPGGFVQVTRYWPGSFVFAASGVHAGSGFKAWRALRRSGGLASIPTLAELELRGPGAPLSFEQASMSDTTFHERMGALLAPEPREPGLVYREQLESLHRLLETRAAIVDQADAWAHAHPGETIPMPSGDGVFSTFGPWEDLATICRDLRLRVALRMVADFQNSVLRAPERYLVTSLEETAVDLSMVYASIAPSLTVAYSLGEGRTGRRSLADILESPDFLEDAYNPNDCPAVRWGASTRDACDRTAPEEQRLRMERYRVWFRNGYGCD